MLLRGSISLLTFCLYFPSVTERGVINFPIVIMNFSVSPLDLLWTALYILELFSPFGAIYQVAINLDLLHLQRIGSDADPGPRLDPRVVAAIDKYARTTEILWRKRDKRRVP